MNMLTAHGVSGALDKPGQARKRTDLAEHERVEDERAELVVLVNLDGVVGRVEVEDGVAGKVEREGGNDLKQSLPKDHHPHLDADEGCSLAIRLALEGLGSSRIGGESEGGEGAKRSESVCVGIIKAATRAHSMIRLTQRSCTAVRTEDSSSEATAEMKVIKTAVMFCQGNSISVLRKTAWRGRLTTEIWNWRNFLTESLTQRPHMMAETMLEKLSSMRMMSDASLATSVPAIPILHHDKASARVRKRKQTKDARESNVGGLERRSVVRSVTGNTDDLAHALEVLDENLLVLGGRTSEDLKTRDDLVAFGDGELAENGALHDDSSGGEDAALGGDRSGGKNVVSAGKRDVRKPLREAEGRSSSPSAHLDADTSRLASSDGLRDSLTKRVLDGGDGDESEVACEVVPFDISGIVELSSKRRPAREVARAKGDGTERLIGVEDDSAS